MADSMFNQSLARLRDIAAELSARIEDDQFEVERNMWLSLDQVDQIQATISENRARRDALLSQIAAVSAPVEERRAA